MQSLEVLILLRTQEMVVMEHQIQFQDQMYLTLAVVAVLDNALLVQVELVVAVQVLVLQGQEQLVLQIEAAVAVDQTVMDRELVELVDQELLLLTKLQHHNLVKLLVYGL
jgi:hypothetical protein